MRSSSFGGSGAGADAGACTGAATLDAGSGALDTTTGAWLVWGAPAGNNGAAGGPPKGKDGALQCHINTRVAVDISTSYCQR